MASDYLVVLGDSVTWGQGLRDRNKFSDQVAKHLSLDPRMHAHSGATIGRGDNQTGHCGPEAPHHYPTILQQLEVADEEPDRVKLVLVDGGINDISVQKLLSPLTTDKELRNLTRRYCLDDMFYLLQRVLDRFSGRDTKVVLTSYFPIFSNESDFRMVIRYLAELGLAPAPGIAGDDGQRAFALRSVELALLFWKESATRLAEAVQQTGSTRVRFANVPYTEANAMFTPNRWLFDVHFDTSTGRLVPEDEVIQERHQQCRLCHLGNPGAVSVCDIASAGHPNVAGAAQFARAVINVLA